MIEKIKKIFGQRPKLDKRKRVAALYSLGIAIALIFCSYILDNQPLFTGEKLGVFSWTEWIKSKLPTHNDDETTQPLYINVAYDKQLTEKKDLNDMPIGNTDITDRGKLLRLMRLLRATDEYKYVFLDVRFEKGYNTDNDSALFAEINRVRRTVVVTHSDMEQTDDLSAKKTATNDYSTIINSSFIRYEYLRDAKPSMPLQAYSEITGKTIDKHGLLYTCDSKPCYNSLFLQFPVKSFEDEYDEDGQKNYYHLGNDILDNYDEKAFAVLTKDRYIVIGDFIEDVHDTYAGSKPGPVITFYAFKALMKGEHFVSFWVLALFFVVYFLISMALFSPNSLLERIPLAKKSKIFRFALSFVGCGSVLTIITIILSLFGNISTSVAIPSGWFSLQSIIINYRKKQ